MRYLYEDLGSEQFETLVLLICQRLFGVSVKGFSTGPDGGRDAKFLGTAELWPDQINPWVGTTIIQAKHTLGHNRHFGETDFFNPTEKNPHSTIGKELPRINKLRAGGELDHYMLVSNRRLSGGVESKLVTFLSKECSLPIGSISVIGLENLELLLRTYPDIPQKANLDEMDSPLIVSSQDLAEIIQILADNIEGIARSVAEPPTPRTPYAQKKDLNGMSSEYSKYFRERHLKEAGSIQHFLAAPENAELLLKYESIVDEFNSKIIAQRKEHQTFDRVLEYLFEQLFSRDPILNQHKHKRLTRAMVFYMYWICDIGRNATSTDKTLTS